MDELSRAFVSLGFKNARIRLDPFKDRKANARAKLYVTFISGEPGNLPELPLFSPKKDVEIIEIRDRDVFSLSHMKNGRFGFPNSFIERQFGVSATTRNWTTITKGVA